MLKTILFIAMASVMALTSACSHLRRSDAVVSQDGTTGEAVDSQVNLKEIESFRMTDVGDSSPVAGGSNPELDSIPTDINPLVEKWINYFQGRGRGHMERYLSRSTRYSALMKKILRQNGLPEDLIYIALIESGFSSKATSHAAAVGYWQFIRGTGKRYGLEINALVDERRDPVLATQAAAEYFKGLYSVFGSWYLAMASYNVGENRVKREVMNNYTRDFWELARKKRLPKETINYVPKFIAAKMIGNNPEKYGFTEIDYMTPIEFESVKVSRPINLKAMAENMNFDYDDFKSLNPKFKGEIAPLKGTTLELRIPVGQKDQALAAAEKSYVERVEYVADSGDTKYHKVRTGETLFTIARKYRTTVAWIRDVNDLSKNKRLKIGQRLLVPDRSAGKAQEVAAQAKPKKVEEPVVSVSQSVAAKEDEQPKSEIVTAKGVFYIVQPGDTLTGIAEDYNSSIEELRKMNRLKRGNVLRVGMRLKVPKDEGLPSDPSVGNGRENRTESGVDSKVEKGRRNSSPRSIAQAPVAQKKAVKVLANSRKVAKKKIHTVKRGENLYLIASKYGVTASEIAKANRLQQQAPIHVGSRLHIPLE